MLALDPVLQDKELPATALQWYKERSEQLAQIVVELRRQVADLQRATITLRQNEALFRATFEQAAVGIAHVAPNGRWLRVNQRLCHILGYTVDELLQSSFQAITHPADLLIDLQGVAQVLAGEIQTYTLHKRYLHKQGHIIWANLTVSLVRTEHGSPAYFVSVIEDITPLKHAEQALQQSEERYRRVVEDQTDLICRFDLNFRLTFVNQPYSKAFGKSSDAMIGENMLDVIPLNYHSSVLTHLATLTAKQRVGTCDNPVQMADGTLRWYHWTDQLIVDGTGQVVEYQSVGRDITERKQAEEAEREQRRYAEALRDSLAMLTSSLDTEKVLQQILIAAATVVPSDAGSIALFEGTAGRVAYLRGFAPEAEAFFAEYCFPLDSPFFEGVLTKPRPYFISDTQATPEWVAFPVTAWIRSSIGIPIERRGKVIGLLIADSATPHHFKPADIEKLQAFARYASLALENADHVARLEQRVAERTAELRYYAGLQENVSDAVISLDLEFRIRSWNRAAETVFGWSAADVIGKPVNKILPVSDLPLTQRNQMEQKLKEQRWWKGEIVQRHKDGKILHLSGAVTILKDETGAPCGMVVIIRDITEQKQAEETLHRYAAEVHDLYNNAPCGYHSIDNEGRFIQINDTELHWLGYSREEVIGRLTLTDLLTPSSQAIFWALFPRFKEQGWIKDIEYELIRKDGSIMNVLLSAVAVYDEQSQFTTSRTTLYDISERKQAQQIIYENERKFRLLVEVAPLAILITDQHGLITLVNEKAEQLFGYTRHELLGQSVECLVPIAARISHPQYRAQNMMAPGVRQMGSGRELFAIRKDGSEFPVEIQLSFAEQQAGCFIMDITERKQAAAALREQHDFLQLVIDSVPDLILVKDRTGQFQLVNERTAQIYGVTPAWLVGKRDIDVHDNLAAVAHFRQQDLATLDSQEPFFIPETIIQERYYQANLIPLKNSDGQYDRVLMVASDITMRKQAEETLQQALATEKGLSELKSRFVSMASHEFRTPLSTIFSLTETLLTYRHKLTDEQIVHRLLKIQEQIGYLNTLMEDVLQLARTQSRRAEFKPMPLDLDTLCRTIIDEFQSQPTTGTRLHYSCESTPPITALDQRLIRQLLNNLVSNALKYSNPNQAVFVKLSHHGTNMRLQVCDQGIGIPEADLKHLFEPFHRAANTQAIAGTGLGLVIAKEAVELHGGSITVDSKVNHGTTFTVDLPL